MTRLLLLVGFLLINATLSFGQNPSFKTWEAPEAIFQRAAKEKKPILLEAFLPTCPHCLAYDKTLRSPVIKNYLDKNFLAYQLDLSKRENGLFLRQHKIFIPSTPSFIILSPEGKTWHVEIMGEELNSVPGILKTLQIATDPKLRDAAKLVRYQQGERQPDLLLSTAFYTRVTMDTTQNMAIVNDYAKAEAPENYGSELNFLLIQKAMLDSDNPIFNYFINHLSSYYAKYDSAMVKQMAENTLMSSIFASRARKYSPERIQSIKKDLSALGIPEKQIAMRFIVLEVLIDLDHADMANAVARINKFYEGKPIPEKEKAFWCKQLTRKGDASSPCPLP
jgi:thioredoxin-related protein